MAKRKNFPNRIEQRRKTALQNLKHRLKHPTDYQKSRKYFQKEQQKRIDRLEIILNNN